VSASPAPARFRSRPPWVLALGLAAGAALTTALGVALGFRWLLPFLGAAVPFAVFFPRVRAGRFRAAVGWVVLWALFQSLAVGAATLLLPDRTGAAVFRGPPYAAEMVHWVQTGEGPEGSPRLFLPIHARHFAAFCVLSALSAGGLGLVLGTVLLNYMNFYVATLVGASARPLVAALFGWPIWAEVRVIGFIVCGAALGALLPAAWSRRRGGPATPRFPGRLFALGVGLILADIVLKTLLAPPWQRLLLRALEGH